MNEFTDLRNNFDALYLQLNGEVNLSEYQQDLLSELHIAFSDYEHYLSGQSELQDILIEQKIEIEKLSKNISNGFAEFLSLYQENKKLKQELETLKKITFE